MNDQDADWETCSYKPGDEIEYWVVDLDMWKRATVSCVNEMFDGGTRVHFENGANVGSVTLPKFAHYIRLWGRVAPESRDEVATLRHELYLVNLRSDTRAREAERRIDELQLQVRGLQNDSARLKRLLAAIAAIAAVG